MAVTYYALLTTIGAGKLANATALGTTLKITQLAVGDGGGNVPTPDASRTQLVNEVRRAPLNRLSVDPANSSQIIAEQVIPEDVGGWWIREMGLYDEAGALIAYANCAPSYKPQLAEGSGRTQTVRIVLIVSNAASVELKIDPSVVLATREYVDNSIVTALNRLDYKQSVLVATTASITLSGLQTVDGVALKADDRVLVKSQNNAADNGLYVVSAGTWKRTTDADESSEVTPGLTVTVESGTAQADSVWQLVTDGAIVLGITALSFQNITNGLAKLASPAFSGTPTAPNPAQGDLSTRLATTSYVRNIVSGSMTKSVAGGVDVTLTTDEVGYGMLTFTGALTANINVIVPNVYRQWVVHNRTSGTFSLTLKTAAGNGVAVTQGRQRMLVCNTVDVYSPELDFVNTSLLGIPTAPTPTQFDSSTSLATTAFVKAAGFQFSGWYSITAPGAAIPSSACGKAIQLALSASGNVSLPLAASVPGGSVLYVSNTSGVSSVSLQRVGTDIIALSPISTSILLGTGDDVLLVSNGVNSWLAVSGTARMGAASAFGAALASSGYQKLPSGLILQWLIGSSDANGNLSATLPIQFPNAFLGGVASEYSPSGWLSNRATVWAVDQAASTKSVMAAKVRDIQGTSGPVLNSGIAGRFFVWGY